MCWQCDHPNATWSGYLDHMRGLVRDFGWAVQAVERSGLHPPWAYTVGLTEAGCPELVATGLSASRAMELLDDVASHLMHSDTTLTPVTRSRLSAVRSSRSSGCRSRLRTCTYNRALRQADKRRSARTRRRPRSLAVGRGLSRRPRWPARPRPAGRPVAKRRLTIVWERGRPGRLKAAGPVHR